MSVNSTFASVDDAIVASLTNFAVVCAVNVEASLLGRAEDGGHRLGCHGGHCDEIDDSNFVVLVVMGEVG